MKELTPEWFTAPAFLANNNSFDLGICQNGMPVGDVELPYWAKTPEEFVAVHRAVRIELICFLVDYALMIDLNALPPKSFFFFFSLFSYTILFI